MGKIIPKITVSFVLLFGFMATSTANAQTAAKSSYIYGIGSDGEMKWYRHNGSATGAGLETPGAWEGANHVGGGWNDYSTVFPGGLNTIYLIRQNGMLEWRQHPGARTGLDQWGEAKTVGRGWKDFKQVFSGGDGIIYAITPEGSLRWYKHNGYLTGVGLETPNAWEGPKEVGRGWADFKTVFSASDGIIYAITQDGKLIWFKHNGHLDGRGLESRGAWEDRKEVGRGWGDFVQVFALLPGSSLRPPSSSTSASNIGEDSFDKLKGRHALQPENSIKVSVRYKKEYGYLSSSNAFGDVGPTSCSAFSVSAFAGDGSAQQLNPTRISSDSKMEVIAGYYVCNYLVSEIPVNQPVRVSVRFSSFDPSVPWKGGSQGLPPPGQQRTIIIVSGRGGNPLTLTATQSRAQQLFEMVYAPRPIIR